MSQATDSIEGLTRWGSCWRSGHWMWFRFGLAFPVDDINKMDQHSGKHWTLGFTSSRNNHTIFLLFISRIFRFFRDGSSTEANVSRHSAGGGWI